MTVQSAQSVTVVFTTRVFSTGVGTNADSLPTGTLYLNGTANGATVTVTNVTTGLYKAAVTMPTLAIGDEVELVISATVSSIADKAVVWGDSKDIFVDGSGDVTFNNTTITTVTGNVNGSVGSVTGAVGSVTGSVGSVTGAVGSVTGNVGGNVTGSVGSVASGGITSASFASGAITTASFAAGAITAAVTDSTFDNAIATSVFTNTMTEAYPAQGAAFTLAQGIYSVHQFLWQKSIASTTVTIQKRNEVTTAKTGTLDSATTPTTITETT